MLSLIAFSHMLAAATPVFGASGSGTSITTHPGGEVHMAVQDTVWTTLIFFLSITVIVCVTVWGRVRRSRLQHETLRVMVEKGVPIPPELFQAPVRRNDLRRGLVWIAIGLGLVLVGLAGSFHLSHGFWALGAIPLLVGAAFLIAWKVDAGQTKP